MFPLSSTANNTPAVTKKFILIHNSNVVAQSDRIEWLLEKGVALVQEQAKKQQQIEPMPHVTATILYYAQDYIYIRWRNDWDIVVWSRVHQDKPFRTSYMTVLG